MSLVEMQSCLARLYVSKTFRALVRGDAQAALAGYALTGEEAAAIEAVDPNMLDVFAATLVGKRRKRFERAYPASFAQHGAALHAVLRRFLEIHPASPATKSHLDMLAFGRFAEETFADHERYVDWAGDLVRFERLSCDATFGQPAAEAGDAPAEDTPPPPALAGLPALLPGVVIDDYRYDVVALEAALRAGDTVPDDTAVARTTIVFRPGRLEEGQQMLRVNGATALVLRRCDGELTVGEIVTAVQSELRAPDLTDPIRDAIGRLQGLRVLSITGGEPGHDLVHAVSGRHPRPRIRARVPARDRQLDPRRG
jgi:hypothetical protein